MIQQQSPPKSSGTPSLEHASQSPAAAAASTSSQRRRVAPGQLRARHLLFVHARNVVCSRGGDGDGDGGANDAGGSPPRMPYFTLHDETTAASGGGGDDDEKRAETLFYTSEALPTPTANPEWRQIEPAAVLPGRTPVLGTCTRLAVAVWDAAAEEEEEEEDDGGGSKKKKKKTPIFEAHFALAQLVAVAADARALGGVVAQEPNTLLFVLADGVYALPDARVSAPSLQQQQQQMLLFGGGSAASAREQRWRRGPAHSYDAPTFVELVRRREQLCAAEAEAEQLREGVHKRLTERDMLLQRVYLREEARTRVERLRAELDTQTAELLALEEPLRERQAQLVARAHGLAEAEKALVEAAETFERCRPLLLTASTELARITRAAEQVQWRLVDGLRVIYPIAPAADSSATSSSSHRKGSRSISSSTSSPPLSSQQQQDTSAMDMGDAEMSLQQQQQQQSSSYASMPPATNLTVCGTPLGDSSDFTGCDEEEVATALGHVCHLLQLSASYLDIPLRYPINAMGSRSTIMDEIANPPGSKFPLYSHGVDTRRFVYAVFLLNKNIEQIISTVGPQVWQRLHPYRLRNTLANIDALFQHAARECEGGW